MIFQLLLRLAVVVYLYVESWTAVGLFDVSPAKVIILGKRNQPRGKKEEYPLWGWCEP